MFFWEDKQSWQTFSQTNHEKKKNQINKIRNEKVEVTTDNAEIQSIIRLLWTTIWQKKKKKNKG